MGSLRRWGMCALVFCTVTGLAATSEATVLSGSLSVGGGGAGNLVATGAWDDPNSTLSWTVDDSNGPGLWHYEYTLTVPVKAISHFIVEVSDADPGPAFTLANLFALGANPQDWTDANLTSVGLFTAGGSNPNMPGNLNGVKFDANDDFNATTVIVSFDSNRDPVWGDFYAKDGKAGGQAGIWASLWNEGFLAADPTDPAADGSVLDHLLVPDSVPEPATVALLAVGAAGFLLRRRCRRA